MIEFPDSTNFGVFAPVASGKTFLLDQILGVKNRYVRFDYTGETNGNVNVEHFYQPKPLLARLQENPYYFRISYHPGVDVMEHYKWCQKAIWMLDVPRVLAIDEYHRICPQRTGMDQDVETSLRLARHNQLGIIGMSQRPQDVNKLFVDSCRTCVIFRSQERNFLEACAGHWGDDVADAVEICRPLIYNDVTKVVKQKQQCVVVTRDGNAARIYDFQTGLFIPMNVFLGEETEESESDSNRDLGEEGTLGNGDVSEDEGDTVNGGSEV